jgi:hypothetical protein
MKGCSLFAGAVLTTALAAAPARAALPIADVSTPHVVQSRDASMDEYRKHLQELTALVEACAKARDAKSCDPALAGADDHVPLGEGARAERRLVRYDWLRALLATAQDKDAAETKEKPATAAAQKPTDNAPKEPPDNSQHQDESVLPPKQTTAELLKDAEARLAQDLVQAGAATAPTPAHAQERETMKNVLAGREFLDLEAPGVTDTLLEKFGDWLNRLFAGAAKIQAKAAWVGRLIVWGFILTICVGLAWGLLQLERRWRIRLVPESAGYGTGAASARDWQLWLEDARKAAAAGLWREAIHFVYWAAISRLESRRLWPADRARTPREYLALVAAEDPRRAGLAALTGSFERIWYGGRAAGENDYRKAEELAEGLIAGSRAGLGAVSTNGARNSGAAEGGAG